MRYAIALLCLALAGVAEAAKCKVDGEWHEYSSPMCSEPRQGSSGGELSPWPNPGDTIGRSYSDMMSGLQAEFDMEPGAPTDGRPKWVGQGKERSTVLELVGQKSDLTSASMVVIIRSGAERTTHHDARILARFLRNINPGWTMASRWAEKSIKESAATGKAVEKFVGWSRVTLQLHKMPEQLPDMIVVTARNARFR